MVFLLFSWATPARNFRVTQLKPESSVVQNEYRLNLYERNVQVSSMMELPSVHHIIIPNFKQYNGNYTYHLLESVLECFYLDSGGPFNAFTGICKCD